jgi:hypothetical protein
MGIVSAAREIFDRIVSSLLEAKRCVDVPRAVGYAAIGLATSWDIPKGHFTLSTLEIVVSTSKISTSAKLRDLGKCISVHFR